jgi:GH25 family lysozyme M1 (1,4-beta-N-acetylmuramidase)
MMVTGFLCVALALSSSAAERFGDYNPAEFGPRGPSGYAVHGIDVARFQGDVDWRRVALSGVAFAWIKATEGGDLKDPQFDRNWQLAARHGVPRGAYHFYYFCTKPEVQARWFIANVPRRAKALPPVLDMEWNPFSPTCTLRPSGAEVRRQARVFLDIVERYYGQRPIIYARPASGRCRQNSGCAPWRTPPIRSIPLSHGRSGNIPAPGSCRGSKGASISMCSEARNARGADGCAGTTSSGARGGRWVG